MNNTSEFRGICPLCYKPIGNDENMRSLKIAGELEHYHSVCLRDCVKQITGELHDKREKWISMQLNQWVAVGQTMQEMREEINISISAMAKSLGVSISRLRRFEKGDPVRDAKLLYNAYILKIAAENIHRQYWNFYNQTQGIDQVYPTLEIRH